MSLKMEATTLKSHKSAAFRGSEYRDTNVSSHESTRNITGKPRGKNNQQLTEDDVPPVPDVTSLPTFLATSPSPAPLTHHRGQSVYIRLFL